MDRTKHIVGFSGGIDSQACARWVLNRFPPEDVILTNSSAGGWESPMTTAFVEQYSREVHPVVVIDAKVSDMWKTPGFAETKGMDGDESLSFERMVQIKGRTPSRKAQFCTDKLKLTPQKRWVTAQFGPGGPYDGWDYVRYTGVRRQESIARKDALVESWSDFFDCPLVYPIADWTKQMCFDYVQYHGERTNPLYALGFNRVGCAPCINSSKEDILNWLIREPAMIDKVRALEANTGRTFFAPMVPGLATNNIDQVIEWAKTGRGGRQAFFPIMHERASCESKYGLCE